MSRISVERLSAFALPVLVVVGIGANVVFPGQSGEDSLLTSIAGSNLVSPAGASVNNETAGSAGAGGGQALPVALPLATQDGSVSSLVQPAPSEADQAEGSSSEADNNPGQEQAASDDDPTEVNGYEVHNFVEHVSEVLGSHMLASGQASAGGFQRLGPYEMQGRSTITAQQPVIEQAITDVMQRNPELAGGDLERKIAKRITELNDWKNLNSHTRENMMIMSGVDIESMDKNVRENTVNHLLHSPLPFGDIDEVLTPDTTINLGYTHTLDKDWTQSAHLGDGIFQIWMVSNNNNGSHTGHNLGSFKVQLTPQTSLKQARDIGNEMVENRNKNGKLYLDEAARRILHGETPWLDFSYLTPEERLATYSGNGLGQGGPPPSRGTIEIEPADTTSTTLPETGETTSTTAAETGETTSTTAAETGETTSTTAAETGETTSTTAAETGETTSTTTS